MNTTESLKFINKYSKHLDYYDMGPLVKRALAKELSEQTGLHVVVNNLSIKYPLLNIERSLDYDIKANVKELKTILKAKKLPLQKALLYEKCAFALEKIAPHPDREESLYSYNAKSLHVIYILGYLINGQFSDDYSDSQNWLIANKINPDLSAYQFTYEGIHVKGFLNGRIDVSGLNQEQKKRLKELFELKDKIQQLRVYKSDKF